jgi:hypothetical protein
MLAAMSHLAVDWLAWGLAATACTGLVLVVGGLVLAVRNGLRLRRRRGSTSRSARSKGA